MTELDQFERHVKHRLEEFLKPDLKKQRSNTRTARPDTGLTVILAVRRKNEITDTRFTHQTCSISKLEARLEAEKAARSAGWPVVAYVVAYQ